MNDRSLAVVSTGLVTSVGLTAPAACAAIRAKVANPTETQFISSAQEKIISHTVPLAHSFRGTQKLALMAAMVVEECLKSVPRQNWQKIPLLLCIAEPSRPGRLTELDNGLFPEIIARLGGAAFAAESGVLPYGRVAVAVGLLEARKLLYAGGAPAVLIVATDTLLTWPCLRALEQQNRLLTQRNSNGFIPGEAGSAVLVSRPPTRPHLCISGIGLSTEKATIAADEPLRANGLTAAISQALDDSQLEMHDMDFRIADVSGEQYYLKEAALAVSRTLRRRKEFFDIWHPAECIGEVGSAIGPAMLALAEAAGRKKYAPGPSMLVHASNDSGQRAAIVARYLGHNE